MAFLWSTKSIAKHLDTKSSLLHYETWVLTDNGFPVDKIHASNGRFMMKIKNYAKSTPPETISNIST